MNHVSTEATIMNKPMSTYERKMQDKKFKEAYRQRYEELLFSELLISIMEDDDKSVRSLAKEADISPSVIQDLRTGKQSDIRVSNLIKIAEAFGYEVILQKGNERFTLQDKVIGNKHNLSVSACDDRSVA
jgi:DNA-binding Xre family transcriptional regulator